MKIVRITLFLAVLALTGCGEIRTPQAADAVAACVGCHTFGEGGAMLSGPNLYGIVGETAGTRPGFGYSVAMRDSGIVWTPQTLDAFLQAPAKFMPGNRMAYFGEVDAARRASIVAYMQGGAAPAPDRNESMEQVAEGR